MGLMNRNMLKEFREEAVYKALSNDPVYAIQEINFDNDENRINDALNYNFLGYIESLKNVEIKINHLIKHSKKYNGWDGNTYPRFKIIELKKLI